MSRIFRRAIANVQTWVIVTLSVAGQGVALIRHKTLLPFFPFSLEFPLGPPLPRLPPDPATREDARDAPSRGVKTTRPAPGDQPD
jgi:hypothetical protein